MPSFENIYPKYISGSQMTDGWSSNMDVKLSTRAVLIESHTP